MIRILFTCVLILCGLNPVSGQVKKEVKSLVQVEIVDAQGIPLKDAKITSSKKPLYIRSRQKWKSDFQCI